MANLTADRIDDMATKVAHALADEGVPLNDSIAELAISHGMNNEQIQRVIARANLHANGLLVKKAQAAGGDPRISFDLAKIEKVAGTIWSRNPVVKTAAESSMATQNEKLGQLFNLRPLTHPQREKTAQSNARRPLTNNIDPADLARAYVTGKLPDHVTPDDLVSPSILHRADAIAADLVKEARQNMVRLDMETGGKYEVLEKIARQQMLESGETVGTLLQILEGDPVAQEIVAAHADAIGIEKRASTLQPHDIVDKTHPMMIALDNAQKVANSIVTAAELAVKINDGAKRLREDRDANPTENVKIASLHVLHQMQSAAEKGSRMDKVLSSVGAAGTVLGGKTHGRAAAERLDKASRVPAVGQVKVASFYTDFATGFSPGGNATFGHALGSATHIALGTAVAGAAVAGLAAVGGAVGDIYEKRKHQKLFEQIVQMEPELKTDPQRAREIFDMTMTYAPVTGKHPRVIADFVKKQLMFPSSSVEFTQSLLMLQKTHNDTDGKSSGGIGSTFTGAVARGLGGGGK